ncbi:hypothetical protein FG386_001124 [Cryptosporidium ryanae]|uniref:uncharacterized protein n=1 Tax=Cryptosporidium ryanae TaxID=515981 RepID=UPI00351A1C4B|nr:hypothetical protein FG386_001124 [Cryptosporidium ryanae]
MAEIEIFGIIFTVKWPYQVPEIVLQYRNNSRNNLKSLSASVPTRECFGIEVSKLAPLILPTDSLLWNKVSELVVESEKYQNRFLFYPSFMSNNSASFIEQICQSQTHDSRLRYIRGYKNPRKYIESFSVTLVLDASIELKYDFIEKKLTRFAMKLLKSESRIGLISSEVIKLNEIMFESFKNRNKQMKELNVEKTTSNDLFLNHIVNRTFDSFNINQTSTYSQIKKVNESYIHSNMKGSNDNIINLTNIKSVLDHNYNDEYIIIEGERSQLAIELGFFIKKLIKEYSGYIFSLDKTEICKCISSGVHKLELDHINCDKISIIIDNEKLSGNLSNSELIQKLIKISDPHVSIKEISTELLEPLPVIIDLSEHLVSRGAATFCETIDYERKYIIVSGATKYKMCEFNTTFSSIIEWRGCNPLMLICSFFCKGNNLFIVKNEIAEFLEKYSKVDKNFESIIYSPYKLINNLEDSNENKNEKISRSIISWLVINKCIVPGPAHKLNPMTLP